MGYRMIAIIDWIIIIAYLATMLLIGFLVGRRETVEDYLVNSRRTKPYLMIFTIISTNVGMGTLIGISSASYSTGISYVSADNSDALRRVISGISRP